MMQYGFYEGEIWIQRWLKSVKPDLKNGEDLPHII